MGTLARRRLLQAGGAGAFGSLAGAAVGWPSGAYAQTAATRGVRSDPSTDTTVRLTGDGLGLSPAQYAHVLSGLAEHGIAEDDYILGGVVEELEARMASLLGKERAVFMPTGTLANNLAIRALAGGHGRAAVQAESHIYLDSGDCVQTLSHVTLMPLAEGRATFGADDLQQLVDLTKTGRVATPITVVSLESPVRRMRGQIFEPTSRAAVVQVARREGIRLHLDGARLFLEAGYSGTSVAEYAKPFDTVYVSLYKYFNAAFGAILAGPRDVLDAMYHTRRMFGSGLSSAWTAAAVALHYLDGFSNRYRRAVEASEALASRLAAHPRFAVTREPHGTNLMRLTVKGSDAAEFRRRLASRGVALGAPGASGQFLVATNETLLRRPVGELVEAFDRALS
jgi:threonine aldolase